VRVALALVVIVMLVVIGVALGLFASEKLEYIGTTSRWQRVLVPAALVLGVAAVVIAATGGL
jgi:hypothetical protein